MTILIIEDDYLLRTGMGSMLLEWGYQVSSAKNGEEALGILQHDQHVDVLICDIFMPELSGPTLLLKLKKIFQGHLPKIIVMSGVKNPDEFLKKIEMPCDVFLPKPIDFVKLKNVLVNLRDNKNQG